MRGYTLIELLVVIVLVGIVGGFSAGIMINMSRSWQLGVDIAELQNKASQLPSLANSILTQADPGSVTVSDNSKQLSFSILRGAQYPKVIETPTDYEYTVSRVGSPLFDGINNVIIDCNDTNQLVMRYDNEIIFTQDAVSNCQVFFEGLNGSDSLIGFRYTLSVDDFQSSVEVSHAIY